MESVLAYAQVRGDPRQALEHRLATNIRAGPKEDGLSDPPQRLGPAAGSIAFFLKACYHFQDCWNLIHAVLGIRVLPTVVCGTGRSMGLHRALIGLSAAKVADTRNWSSKHFRHHGLGHSRNVPVLKQPSSIKRREDVKVIKNHHWVSGDDSDYAPCCRISGSLCLCWRGHLERRASLLFSCYSPRCDAGNIYKSHRELEHHREQWRLRDYPWRLPGLGLRKHSDTVLRGQHVVGGTMKFSFLVRGPNEVKCFPLLHG